TIPRGEQRALGAGDLVTVDAQTLGERSLILNGQGAVVTVNFQDNIRRPHGQPQFVAANVVDWSTSGRVTDGQSCGDILATVLVAQTVGGEGPREIGHIDDGVRRSARDDSTERAIAEPEFNLSHLVSQSVSAD